MLEDLLAAARRGDLRAVAIATVERGELTNFQWDAGSPGQWHTLAAAVGDLGHEILAARAEMRRGVSASSEPA